MLTNTMTTKECLHRFCSECIITALRSGNKECPTCRKKLVSKRCLRPDPNFDQLVEKIFPNRDEYEAQQEEILESLNRSHSQNFITSITDGIKAQMANVKALQKKSKQNHHHDLNESGTPIVGRGDDDDVPLQRKKKKATPARLDYNSGSDSNQGSASSAAPEIEIVFQPHSDLKGQKLIMNVLKDNPTRYIKTTSRALIEHLCKYLATRIALEFMNGGAPEAAAAAAAASSSGPGTSSSNNDGNNINDMSIYMMSNGKLTALSHDLSLAEVNEKYWNVNKPMEMFYFFKRD